MKPRPASSTVTEGACSAQAPAPDPPPSARSCSPDLAPLSNLGEDPARPSLHILVRSAYFQTVASDRGLNGGTEKRWTVTHGKLWEEFLKC